MNYLAQVDLGSTYGSPLGQTKGLGDLSTLIISAAIAIAGAIFVFLIVGGGFKVIQGAGNNDPKSAGQGREALTMAIIGFFIIFGAYWIIRVLETVIGNNFFTGGLS